MVFSVSSLSFIVSFHFLVASSFVSFILSKILLFLMFYISHVVSVTIYLSFGHSGAGFSCSLSFIAPRPLSILTLGFIHWKFLSFFFHVSFASCYISSLLFSLHSVSMWSIVSVSLHSHIALSCQFEILLNQLPTLWWLCISFHIKSFILKGIFLFFSPFYMFLFVIQFPVFLLCSSQVSFILSCVGFPLGFKFFSWSISS